MSQYTTGPGFTAWVLSLQLSCNLPISEETAGVWSEHISRDPHGHGRCPERTPQLLNAWYGPRFVNTVYSFGGGARGYGFLLC